MRILDLVQGEPEPTGLSAIEQLVHHQWFALVDVGLGAGTATTPGGPARTPLLAAVAVVRGGGADADGASEAARLSGDTVPGPMALWLG